MRVPSPALLLLILLLLLVGCESTSNTRLIAPATNPAPAAGPPTIGMSGPSTTVAVTAPRSTYDLGEEPWFDGPWGAAGGVSFYHLYDAEFRIAAQREDWDRAERFELNFYSREPVNGNVEALIGGFIYREERDWEEGTQKVIVDAWGIGVDMGAMIYPFEGAENRNVNVGIAPYARFAIGANDGDFRGIDANLPGGGTGFTSGELGDLRFDVGVGLDVRMVVGRSIYFGIGTGLNWWTTTDGSVGTTRDGGGVIIIQDDEFDFKGSEGFVRATVGFYW